MRRLLLVLVALLLAACTTASAQSSEPTATPLPTPLPAAYPENVVITAGLDHPERWQDKADPGPYINATWDEPPERVAIITIEIYDEDGNGRPTQRPVSGPIGLNLVFDGTTAARREVEDLRDAGCTIERNHVRITGDCIDRYRIVIWGLLRPYPVGFISPGTSYEIRVIFTNKTRGYAQEWTQSSTHTVSIPKPTRPTPTPQPTATPRPTPTPTATPAPVRLPGPTTPEIAPTPTSAASVFQETPRLGAAAHFDNGTKRYRYYTQDGWTFGDLGQVRTLTQFMPGEVYFLWVSGSVTVNGHALTCGSNCMNVVVW